MSSETQNSLELGTEALDGGTVCFGRKFESESARRAYYTERLKRHLADPAFRAIPGFPEADDEDILRLSDPPYYTACPNPFLADFVGGPQREYVGKIQNKPFTGDLSEGRSDWVYTAHPYHTKVPPRAIAQAILHYTQPGDVVLDVFAGSGMTGVGALYCADPEMVLELGGEPGHRRVILCDLAPVATFISSVYLRPPDADEFAEASERLLSETEEQLAHLWTFETEEGEEASIEFQVWAEEFACPVCQRPVASARVVEATMSIGTAKEFPCPHCDASVSKAPNKKSEASRLERQLVTVRDPALNDVRPEIPRRPLFAQVQIAGERLKVEPSPDHLRRLKELPHSASYWFPTNPLIRGERFVDKDCNDAYGITHVHHFYTPRQLQTYATLWNEALKSGGGVLSNSLKYFIQTNGLGMTVMNRYGPTHYSQVNRVFSGTLYVPSILAETAPRYTYDHKRKRLVAAFETLGRLAANKHAITTQSATALSQLPADSVDYVFVDPPFGRNLQYSELNQVWEAWLRVKTVREPEAILDRTQNKGIASYTRLMREAYVECYRALKPGRWMTVVFHNSENRVWMALQEALSAAGFTVADVSTLSKKSETYKQSRQQLVKQDLIISAYKPETTLRTGTGLQAGTVEDAWRFTREYLSKVPVVIEGEDVLVPVTERKAHLLFDRMLAFFVQREATVPISYGDFRLGLSSYFVERDGMFFLLNQVAEYDRRRAQVSGLGQLKFFVNDEASAIHWIRQELETKPRSFQDLQPEFMKELQAWAKHEITVELKDILEQNFLRYDGEGQVPAQIHSYLSTNYKTQRGREKEDPQLKEKARGRWYVPDPNKQGDLEKLRERALLKEFEQYRGGKQKLKEFRTEAVRAGFKAAYDERDYDTIVVVAERLPEAVLQEHEKLLMYYDVASMRLE